MNPLETGPWADAAWNRIHTKLAKTSRRIGSSLAFVSVGGRYQEFAGREEPASWWTNSFWAGLCWLAYRETLDPFYRQAAEAVEGKLDAALEAYDGLHHDLGFMWSLSAVASFQLTGSDRSRRRALTAASLLAGRFNLRGRFLRAWNGDKKGWAIVDCLMNLPLLYWASRQSGDDRFAQVAQAHADTALTAILRPDGSVNHIVSFDPETGALVESLGGQGYGVGSSWSRGQAWALYGFALSHRHTGEGRYLDAAKRVAHYFLAALGPDGVPDVDFRCPEGVTMKDSTAGAIAAAGLLEIADAVPPLESPLYRNAGFRLLVALDQSCGAWDRDEEGLLTSGTHAYHPNPDGLYPNNHSPIIYGDYFFVEAVLRLRGQTDLFW